MAIITLTTDMGLSDYYVAAVKGALMRELPGVAIVDVCHDIPKFDLLKAAYNLKNAFRHFPEGTIHIVGVNALEDADSRYVALEVEGHWFVGTDNGIFSLLFDRPVKEIVQLNPGKNKKGLTFPVLELFVKAAVHLAKKGSLKEIGRPVQDIRKMLMPAASIGERLLRGSIIYVDSYGNLVTNITRELFDEVGNGHRFSIGLLSSKYSITEISHTYNYKVGEGDLLALFNYSGHLEIAMNKGSAGKLLGLKVNDQVRIEFNAD